MNFQDLHANINARRTLLDGRQAIVIGGSMAGVLTARVLSNHFDSVTIIERDHLPEKPAPRPGIPQARHLHALLPRGCKILEAMFPGFGNQMLEAGAVELAISSDVAWLTPGGFGVNFPSDMKFFAFTRDLLDWAVRRRIREVSKIRFIEECEVTGLLTNADRKTVNGISLRYRPSAGDKAGFVENLFADLIVDASGRNSKTPAWLTAIGYEAPEETVINAHIGYATRMFEIPAGYHPGWEALFIQAAPPNHLGAGLIFPVEGHRWMATLSGGDRNYPPTDGNGFLEFARRLRVPHFYEAIKNARPISDVVGYRSTENRLRHYERLSRRPENLLVIGDGACAFNPVYGQGMTTAALGAELLDRCLSEQKYRQGNLTGLAANFQKQLAKLNTVPWTLATGEDCRYRTTEGGTLKLADRLIHRYLDNVFQLATHNVPVRHELLQVQAMLKMPPALFHPTIVLQVMGNVIKNTFRSAQTETETLTRPQPMPRLNHRTSSSKF